MMQRRWRQRGSVLLLAVGLLSILAMLGATLLLSSYLDARQSRALAAKAQADPVATGILAQVKAALQADLNLGTNGPYEGLSADANGWREFIDHPSEDPDADFADPFLSSEIGAATVHFSDLFGVTGTDYADTDGDGTDDAYRIDTGVTNALGQRYYAAVRVTDMSSKICLNTAGTSNALTTPTSPVNIDLESFLSTLPGTPYSDLHVERCGSAATPQDFFDNSASTLFMPAAAQYRPFAIGEEMYYRWLGQGQLTTAGRLAPIFNAAGLPVSTARQLTTFNCSRTLVRDPQPATPDTFHEQFHLDFRDPSTSVFFKTSPAGEAKREDVYQKVKGMLKDLGIGGGTIERQEMAAHFVANMWAYQDYSPANADKAYKFVPTSSAERFAVYGLIPDLVIIEAFAAHDDGDPGIPDDYTWGYAIEVANFTDRQIVLNDSNYELIVFPGLPANRLTGTSVALNPGQRVVLYDYFIAGAGTLNEKDIFGVKFDAAKWEHVPGLDFSQQPTLISLLRIADGGTERVPADHVSNVAAELDYNCGTGSKDNPWGTKWSNIRRDDRPVRARFNVAAYKRFSGTLLPVENRLGQLNNQVNADDLTSAPSPAVFSVPIICSGQQIADLGELGLIYLTGPIDEDINSTEVRNLKSFPWRLAQLRSILPDGPARGRFDFHPEDIDYMGYAYGTYPDVPAAAMLGEFFTLVPPDITRVDESPDEWTRIYGRVNINTATKEVLMQLPWPTSVAGRGTDPNDIVDYILAYRDQTDVLGPGPHDYRDTNPRSDTGASAVANLRDPANNSDIGGFLTPGELAIPLADYANWRMGWLNYSTTASDELSVTQDRDYIYNRDSLYRAISNLITVNSDVYAVNIRVDLYDINEAPDNDPPDEPIQSWYYVSVIDRSNCSSLGDTPAVLLFSEVK